MTIPVIPPRRIEEFFNKDGTFTLRALRFFETLTDNLNETAESVEDIVTSEGSQFPNSISLQQLRREFEGLPEFTMDTTGFTMDSTEFTMDKVIA